MKHKHFSIFDSSAVCPGFIFEAKAGTDPDKIFAILSDQNCIVV